MTETRVPVSNSPDGPSHLSASVLPINEMPEAAEVQTSPPGEEVESGHKFLIELYSQQGSMWTMSMHGVTMEFGKNYNPINIFECWKYNRTSQSHLSPIIESKEIKEDEIEAWVNTATPSKEGLKPVAGYKILQMDSPPGPAFPLKGKTYQAVIEAFKLPPIELHMGSLAQGACGVFREEDGSFLLINRRPDIRVTVSTILRYDPLTNITSGYIITDQSYYDIPFLDFSFLPTQFIACPHPILLPILIIEQTLYTRVGDVGQVAHGLEAIEQVTGFTSNTGKKTEDLRLQDIVRKLGEQHAYYSSIQTSFLVLKPAIAILKRELEYMDSDGLPDEAKEKLTGHVRRLRDRIKYLENSLEHALLDGNIQTRLQAQQQVLFNLIAQADTKINIGLAQDSREIAAASKQDSSAMKIIAMLTTLFLPGTFIATFFAMPLFNWQELSIYHVTNQHFWVYWVVAGPLTLVTMILVISWAYWHRSHFRAEVWRAREGTGERKTADDDLSNKGESPSPDNRESSAELMGRWKRGKRVSKAILRRRQLWRKGNLVRQGDPESLRDP